MRTVRILLFLALGPLVGNAGRRLLLRALFRAEVDATATVGVAIVDATRVALGPQSRIGHFTIIRNLDELILEQDGRIGTFNWIFGARGSRHFQEEADRTSALVLRNGASVTSRHILDCTDRIEVGEFSTVAGFYSQILTHSIDVVRNRQSCAPVRIGGYSFIGTRAVILKGASFPERSVLSAGSVFSGSGEGDMALYSGVPAARARDLPEEAGYMKRSDPRVG